MAWIESHTVLVRHRKTICLAVALAIKPVQAVGHLHALWHSVLEQAEDGDLSQWEDAFIAAASCWEGDPVFFCKSLREFGWLDGNLVHDWMDYAGRYLESKYRTSNPEYLKQIKAKHKTVFRQTKDAPPNQPNQPNQPNLTKPNLTDISTQTESLLTLFNPILKDKILIYLSRIANKNKSKIISGGRKLTLITELYNTKQRCNNDALFGDALDASISRDACCIGYVNAVIKNKKTERPR